MTIFVALATTVVATLAAFSFALADDPNHSPMIIYSPPAAPEVTATSEATASPSPAETVAPSPATGTDSSSSGLAPSPSEMGAGATPRNTLVHPVAPEIQAPPSQ